MVDDILFLFWARMPRARILSTVDLLGVNPLCSWCRFACTTGLMRFSNMCAKTFPGTDRRINSLKLEHAIFESLPLYSGRMKPVRFTNVKLLHHELRCFWFLEVQLYGRYHGRWSNSNSNPLKTLQFAKDFHRMLTRMWSISFLVTLSLKYYGILWMSRRLYQDPAILRWWFPYKVRGTPYCHEVSRYWGDPEPGQSVDELCQIWHWSPETEQEVPGRHWDHRVI